jgi:RNA polymerase sigma-70 factor (ECF subfamily)
MMMPSEQELVAALRRREPDAFERLFETYSDKAYRLAVALLEDETEADCVVQDTFLRLLERLDQFEGRSQLSTWLYRVAYNISVDRLRKRRPTVTMAEEANDDAIPSPTVLVDWEHLPESLLTESEMAAELKSAIAALPEKFRVVFILREIEGLSTAETAVVTDLSLSAVKVRLHRARLFLRERLAESFATSMP